MPDPFNYAIDVPNPTDAVMKGYAFTKQYEAEQAARLQQQNAMAQQAAMQSELASVSKNATPGAIASLMVKYPTLSENFKRSYDVLNAEQKQNRSGQATQVHAALQAGQPDVAQRLLKEQAGAARNAGNEQEAKSAETFAELVKLNPEMAKTSSGMFLAHALGPDKFAETFGKLGSEERETAMAPIKLSEAQSNATKAAVAAKFAESDAVAELTKKGWDVKKIQADIDIAKQNSRIAAMNAATAKEGNDIKRLELGQKLADAYTKRDEAVREKAAKLETGMATLDNTLATIDKALATPLGVIDRAAGTLSSKLPTVGADVADFEALVETMGSQAFMSQVASIGSMTGLTEAEGKKLQAAVQNLSLKQSAKTLVSNIKDMRNIFVKAKETMARKNGMPSPAASSEPTPTQRNITVDF